jgi:hypothetical protein
MPRVINCQLAGVLAGLRRRSDTLYVRHPEVRCHRGDGQERRASQGKPPRQERSGVSYADGPDIARLRHPAPTLGV